MSEKKRGRPVKPGGRTYQYRIRLTEKEHNLLEFISSESGLPKSTIFRAALQLYYAMRYENASKK